MVNGIENHGKNSMNLKNYYDVNVNKYKVKCGTLLRF